MVRARAICALAPAVLQMAAQLGNGRQCPAARPALWRAMRGQLPRSCPAIPSLRFTGRRLEQCGPDAGLATRRHEEECANG